MISIIGEKQDNYKVFLGTQMIGSIEIYENNLHKRNCYVKLELKRYDAELATDVFHLLQDKVRRPLQIMIDSTEDEKIAFLEKAGFQCKRKCYDLEVTANQFRSMKLKMEKSAEDYSKCKRGMAEYNFCARLMYEYYREKHENINPLTADYESFLTRLPEEVFYKSHKDRVLHVAFVEENEIAYVGTRDNAKFQQFISGVVSELFEEHEELFFECDDCDEAAMTLMNLFECDMGESYNTYIKA